MKNTIKYIISFVLLLLIAKIYISDEIVNIFNNLKIFDVSVSIIIALVIYFVSGLQYQLLISSSNSNNKFSISDLLLFPITLNLWSYIIPFQGSMIYSTLFLRERFHIKLTESFTLNIYILLVNIVLTGLIGLIFSIYTNSILSLLGLIALSLLLSPIFIFVANLVLKRIGIVRIKLLSKLLSIISQIVDNSSELWSNKNLTLYTFGLNILHLMFSIVWYWWIAHITNLNVDFISVTLLTLFLRISMIFKITPGNLGIEQIVSGLLMSLIGSNPQFGIIISLYTTITTLLIVFTIGVYSNFQYMKYFEFKSITQMIHSLRSQKSTNE